MGQFAWVEQVAALSAMLSTLETQARQGTLGATGLEELKSGLDDLRLRAWGLLTASSSDDPQGFQERFRTRRGIEMCRALSTDVRTGKLSGRRAELPGLGDAAGELATAVKAVTRKTPEGKPAKRTPPKRRDKGAG
jgi:hypothetical protein